MITEALEIVSVITFVFDTLKIPYFIGGSFASGIHGLPRATRDVDFVAAIKISQIDPLVAALENEFYLDSQSIRAAITAQRSFNIIHLETMFKADIFVLSSSNWAHNQFQRRELRQLTGEVNAPTAWVSSAEDIVLQKLLWFEKGGRISTQQWDDISGVLKVSAKILDFDYLVQWSSELGLTELLHKAYLDAGITPDNNHL